MLAQESARRNILPSEHKVYVCAQEREYITILGNLKGYTFMLRTLTNCFAGVHIDTTLMHSALRIALQCQENAILYCVVNSCMDPNKRGKLLLEAREIFVLHFADMGGFPVFSYIEWMCLVWLIHTSQTCAPVEQFSRVLGFIGFVRIM